MIVAYAKAMAALAQNILMMTRRRFIMRSRSTLSADPADKTYSSQLKGAAILEPIACGSRCIRAWRII